MIPMKNNPCILCNLWSKTARMVGPRNTQNARIERRRLSPGDTSNHQGGLGKMYQLFGDHMDALIAELNSELTA
ncbi:MAG: hypothetical protein EA353_06265 [Puniceicoccaceae bacterium]|nr:MAG: hypothetical protein EA353_06265 [Puniceicoccaceae bacterium]